MEVGSNLIATESELRDLGVNLSELKEDLTLPNPEFINMKRFGKGRFYRKIEPNICYLRKEDDRYIVPRYYVGELEECGNSGRTIEINFKFKLRDYQKEFLISFNIDNYTGILLEAGCGSGKTIMGIYISMLRSVQTLVLVPTHYLAKQWKQRIEESTDSSCYIIKSTDTKIPLDSDFTIISMDLFACRTFPKDFASNIGHVILDEAHRVGAETYLPILDEIPAKYRTALTATFRRSDGVHKILSYHFGQHLKMESRFPRPSVYGVRTGVNIRGVISKNRPYEKFIDFLDRIDYPYHETKGTIEFEPSKNLSALIEKHKMTGSLNKTEYAEITRCFRRGCEMSYPVVDSYLAEHSGRRKIVIQLIRKCLDAGRTVLFLSKRKDILRVLYKYFSAYKPMLIVSETNSRSEEDDEYLQNSCPLILGVTQLAKEGLDIDRLDTLIIHLPMKDTEQAIGRISRLHKSKKPPICFYLVDDSAITYAVLNNAKKFFKINSEYKENIGLNSIERVI